MFLRKCNATTAQESLLPLPSTRKSHSFRLLPARFYIRTHRSCLTPVRAPRHLSLTQNTFVVQPPCLLFPLACLLKASLRRRSERGLSKGGFGEFCGNLNNYTPCSPRVINYICGKGFLILESSTDKGWWGERQEG